MPTNEEHRKVAARLQHVAEHGAPEWATTACCIAECLGEDDYSLWSGSEKLFDRLADLIEPEPERTCRNIHPDVFQCSECYAIDEDWKHPPFCHGCGAKVVE